MPDFYGTEEGLEAYAEARGVTLNSSADALAALHRSSTWLDANWGSSFTGYKTGGRAQLRAWPRTAAVYHLGGGVYEDLPDDVVPTEVEYATYEGAIQEMTTPGSLQPVVTPNTAIKKVSVEGALSVEYADVSVSAFSAVLTSIDGILAPLITGNIDYGSGLFGTATRV